ncbi:MAG TPA: TIGR00730 family Rossman fold protein [Ramlibacter sp.]|nr:TIGR00730 family Rossman fold protein [Ramlibacter sp.]
MTAPFSVCVYCSSRQVAPGFVDAAVQVGRWIGERGGQLVYGGGNNGLMGVVADATLQAGGRVVGVIPQALVAREFAKRDCTELHIVESMHERKSLMAQRCDAFLALPGGIGTFEELFEVWTWRQLGYHDKPLGLLDAGGYYSPLLAFLRSSVDQGFLSQAHMDLLRVGSDAPALLARLVRESAGAERLDLSQI